jgi:5-methylcytosine-specific restriction endonuclease McrA
MIRNGKAIPQSPDMRPRKARGAKARRWQRIRKQVIALHGWVCHLCGRPIPFQSDPSDPDALTFDHLKPKVDGGGRSVANLRPAHKICNNLRGDKPAELARKAWMP